MEVGRICRRSFRCAFREGLAVALLLLLLLALKWDLVESSTNPSDVQALGVLYTFLNSPPQLSGWQSSGGDPCGASWKGITCVGSSVTSIQLSGLGLTGSLGYLLSGLSSLKSLDMSKNSIYGGIPYQLPPNVSYLNLASNNLTGSLPYSISFTTSLNYLNFSHNSLSTSIGDFFSNLQNLSVLDLSFNNLSGDVPNSMSALSNLSSLYLQDNQLTGSVNVLGDLGLTNLNVANNHFNGSIPKKFNTIPNLVVGGNLFVNNPSPSLPSQPPTSPDDSDNSTQTPSTTYVPAFPQGQVGEKGLSAGAVTGITLGCISGVFCGVLLVLCCLRKFTKEKDDCRNSATAYSRNNVKYPPSCSGMAANAANVELQDEKINTIVTDLRLLPSEKVTADAIYGKNGSMKRAKVPITATSYSVASLQMATNSFSQDYLVGEGSLGRVYRAEFSNGKVLAVKKIDSAAATLQEEDNFLEAVSNMSRLRHPNITTLVGYCVEHGQRLLVCEYIGKGTLHDILHVSDDSSLKLSWNARVRVALGMARALEYLHEVCLPPIVHRNFKSANILLDEELKPHLSDCGLAALAPTAGRQVSTQMVGAFGYSAPEYAMSGVYTVKSDVYSFGVVMLELLTGRKPLDSSRVRSEQSLVRWATPQLHDIDALAKMVDPTLNGMYPAKSLSRFADIIALCVQPEPEFRPPMSEAVQSLVRLMQRASTVRSSGDDFGFSGVRISDHEGEGGGGAS